MVYATGAQTDKSLGIPGEDLPGSWAATEFVAWYNGHPDYRDLEFDLPHERAVVIGNGNVAADVTRLLTRSPDELARTDVADHALEALRRSAIREVVVLGRRGPAQAAFTSAELRELGHMEGVDLRVDPAEVELDPLSAEWLAEQGTFTARKNVQLLHEFAQRPPGSTLRGASSCASSCRPSRSRREAVVVRRNEIVKDDRGLLRARATDAPAETIEAGLVLRSVGYQAVPLPGVPFDERAFVLPNESGRVLDAPGVYTVGWIKRGPTGILGTNKRDAEETIACLAEDLRGGVLRDPEAERADRRPARGARGRRGHRGGLARDRRARAGGGPRRGPPQGQAGFARRAAGRGGLAAPAAAMAAVAAIAVPVAVIAVASRRARRSRPGRRRREPASGGVATGVGVGCGTALR